jgi:hypothetical protein
MVNIYFPCFFIQLPWFLWKTQKSVSESGISDVIPVLKTQKSVSESGISYVIPVPELEQELRFHCF